MKKKYPGNEVYKIDFLRGTVGKWRGGGRSHFANFPLSRQNGWSAKWVHKSTTITEQGVVCTTAKRADGPSFRLQWKTMQDAGISQVVENNRTTCHSTIFPISYLSRFRPAPEGGGLGGYPINLLFRTDNKNVHVRKNVNVNRRLVCKKFVAKIAKRMTAFSLFANNEVWKNSWRIKLELSR